MIEECSRCGCTDDDPCPGGCSWVAPFLCSACADTEDDIDPAPQLEVRRDDFNFDPRKEP